MPARKLISITASIFLIMMAVYVSILAYADILDSRANATIRSWTVPGNTLDKGSWNDTLVQLQRAQKLDPLNGDVYEKQGQLYRIKSFEAVPMSDEHIKASEQALTYFKQAVIRRPAWPMFWSSVIQSKHTMWQYDDEMEQAIIIAAHTGPWFENNHPAILSAGIRGWTQLSEEGQEAVISILRNAIIMKPRQGISIALNSGKIDYVMPMIQKDTELKKVYRQLLVSDQRKAQHQLKKLKQ